MYVARQALAIARVVAVSVLIAVVAGCVTPGQQLSLFIDGYKRRPEPKALAIGYYPNGNWVAGSAWQEPSLDAAKTTALRRCEEQGVKRGAPVQCRIVYENENFVPQSAAAAPASKNGPVSRAPTRQTPATPVPPTAKSITGSGVFISQDGLVLTAEHVIRGAKHIEVLTRDGTRVRARVQSASRTLDLAILATNTQQSAYMPVRLTRPTPGARVFTVGYPVPGVLGQEPKVSDGIVNAVSGIRDDAGFMQISIPLQPGNSGGPVVTEDGTLVGVVTSSAAIAPFLERTGTIPQNVGWAVHASLAVTLLGREGTKTQSRTREQAIADTLRASVLILANED